MSKYFNNILYGINSFFTGLKVTWSHFINKKDMVATLQYPHEKWPIPERNIGFDHSEYNLIRSRLHVDIDDCIACMQCERACPVDCIKIDSIKPPKDNGFDCGMTSNDTQKKMIVSRFTIDMSECMYCNLCVYPCPEECIYMVGGPNDKKHEIDYEFSQYKRDGMIFEFSEATDDQIRECGGNKWLQQRDATLKKNAEGIELMGTVQDTASEEHTVHAVDTKTDAYKKATIPKIASSKLEINSFNMISDKMCRGIAKKAFMAANRDGKDEIYILADVAQALSDGGKMTIEIQAILDGLMVSDPAGITLSVDEDKAVKGKNTDESAHQVELMDIDIKDLNIIENKMVRGIAKKAFLSAKRTGGDKVETIRRALIDADKLDTDTEKLLNPFSNVTIDNSKSSDAKKTAVPVEDISDAPSSISEPESNLSLFEITELNGIDDRMTRGMAKKIYTAGKRAEKSRMEVIMDIRDSLKSAGKLDNSTSAILAKLESEN